MLCGLSAPLSALTRSYQSQWVTFTSLTQFMAHHTCSHIATCNAQSFMHNVATNPSHCHAVCMVQQHSNCTGPKLKTPHSLYMRGYTINHLNNNTTTSRIVDQIIRQGFNERYLSTTAGAVHNDSHSNHNISNGANSDSSSSSDTDDMSGQESYGSVSDVRAAVLDAALQHVPLLGWTEAAIAKGAEELGYSCAAHSLVEGGGAELFLWLQRRLNQQVEEHLEEFTLQGGEKRDVMLEALKQRLLLLMPYRAVYAQGLGTLATSPSLLGESISITASLADIVCHYSGSNQPDTSWYVDRASVAAVYKLTELCYLQDQSADCQETLQFLQRRVQEAQQARGACDRLQAAAAGAGSTAHGLFLTGLNLLGLNSRSR